MLHVAELGPYARGSGIRRGQRVKQWEMRPQWRITSLSCCWLPGVRSMAQRRGVCGARRSGEEATRIGDNDARLG